MPATAVFLIVAVLDHLEVTISPEMVPAVALSLVEALAQVPDLRQARGMRHGVPAILLLGPGFRSCPRVKVPEQGV